MANERDPRVDPKKGDVVLAIGPKEWPNKWGEITYNPMKVHARVEDLVAFTEDGRPNKVVWLLLSSWCEIFDPITEWKVIHAAK